MARPDRAQADPFRGALAHDAGGRGARGDRQSRHLREGDRRVGRVRRPAADADRPGEVTARDLRGDRHRRRTQRLRRAAADVRPPAGARRIRLPGGVAVHRPRHQGDRAGSEAVLEGGRTPEPLHQDPGQPGRHSGDPRGDRRGHQRQHHADLQCSRLRAGDRGLHLGAGGARREGAAGLADPQRGELLRQPGGHVGRQAARGEGRAGCARQDRSGEREGGVPGLPEIDR